MYKTLPDIVQDVIGHIGLVSNTGVQLYTEPQVVTAVNDAVTFLFRKRFWDHLSDWYTYALDGTTGLFTLDIDDIVKSPEDAKDFFEAQTQRRIAQPVKQEHLLVTNASPMYYTKVKYSASATTYAKKVFKFWPIDATGSVTFFARTHPGVFALEIPEDEEYPLIPFESDILSWAATWLVLESDGLNPGGAAKAQTMFDVSYRDYISAIADDVIGHGGGGRNDYFTIR